MPVLKSLKNPVVFCEDTSVYRTGIQPVGKIVSDITDEILKEKPMLLINAYSDIRNKNMLKSEIMRIMDKSSYFANVTREELLEKIYNYMFGYGELQKYIENEDISDIDATGFNQFSVVEKGKRKEVEINMGDMLTFETYCKLIAVRNGGILNENDSHCRVTDLSKKLRINVSIPPRNISGPAISIRKHRNKSYSYLQLKELGMIDEKAEELIRKYSESKKTLLFSGKGGAGKTTLMRTFINGLDEMERVLIAESDAEIYPEKKFCIEQRVKKDNEGGSQITLDMLVRDGLTMSLDTYCIGEIVSGEAYDFIKASCSGHRMVATIHADSCSETILRLISLASGQKAVESEKTLYEMVSSGLDAIVFLEKFKVKEIAEIIGYDRDIQRPMLRTQYGRKF